MRGSPHLTLLPRNLSLYEPNDETTQSRYFAGRMAIKKWFFKCFLPLTIKTETKTMSITIKLCGQLADVLGLCDQNDHLSAIKVRSIIAKILNKNATIVKTWCTKACHGKWGCFVATMPMNAIIWK